MSNEILTESDFDKEPVLDRMELQLKKNGIETEFTKNINTNKFKGPLSSLLKIYKKKV